MDARAKTTPKAKTTPSLTMKRRLNASPAEVYRAWTDPKLLTRWFGPENVETLEAELDVRVGGVYRIVMLENTGERHQVSGAYQEVVANERLVFSWSWVTTPERVSRVTVTLKPDGDITILTLLHEQLFDEQAVKGHTHGWTGSMVKLEALFA
ncbi:SRPBCC domain-containing protein [Bosea sp. LjRoot9]|uniref:SRPBCC family protein n=1 Tax=Bosea sp. LjRoot9 TaxID=3342341 RepID=UPI003ECCB69E